MKLCFSQLWTQFLHLPKEAWKILDFNGVWTRDLAIPVPDALTNWAMKPLTLGAGHLWVLMFPFRLFHASAKIAFITAKIIASLWFHIRSSYMIHFIYIISLCPAVVYLGSQQYFFKLSYCAFRTILRFWANLIYATIIYKHEAISTRSDLKGTSPATTKL